MATKPKIVTLTNSSVDILNAIRNNATINYKNYVPQATPDAESIREIGAIIMDMPMVIYCKDDCKGLCPVCVANLNHGDCGHGNI